MPIKDKIKIFDSTNLDDLENIVNEWLSDCKKIVQSVHHSSVIARNEKLGEDYTVHTIVIHYKE